MNNLQGDTPFEVVIVEDGSSISSEAVIKEFRSELTITYLSKSNSGPGDSRNYGMERAAGNYFLILDSDCLLPPHYLQAVDQFLEQDFYHCFGGSDAAHPDFDDFQKAVSHVMTSFLTTGGIRGSKRSLNQFEPRSFNMGLSKEAFEASLGFGTIHPGEDPDLSLRLLALGYKTVYLDGAFVYHKRRINISKFYNQVKKFGLVRPIITSWHPGSARITYWLPTLFVLGVVICFALAIGRDPIYLLPLTLYCLAVMTQAVIGSASIKVGLWAVVVLFAQFFGYGLAFLSSTFKIRLLQKDPEQTYPELFFN